MNTAMHSTTAPRVEILLQHPGMTPDCVLSNALSMLKCAYRILDSGDTTTPDEAMDLLVLIESAIQSIRPVIDYSLEHDLDMDLFRRCRLDTALNERAMS